MFDFARFAVLKQRLVDCTHTEWQLPALYTTKLWRR